MPISNSIREKIKSSVCETLDKKLTEYSRETSYMPFLVKLMQSANKVATYSFIHSLTTTLGVSIYENVSKIMVQDTAVEAQTRLDLGGAISDDQRNTINRIIEELKSKKDGRSPNAAYEKSEVMAASTDGASIQKTGERVDFYYLAADGIKRYFEIKTAKPNMDVFTASKRKLLEWIARKREKNMADFLAIPYNPYHPKPYKRFTLENLFEMEGDFLVAEQYWDLLSGETQTLENLFEIFDEVGKEYKEKINEKLKIVSSGK